MITVYIKLTIAGSDVGPFDLYSNATSPTFSDPPFEQNIPRQSLIDGYLCSDVPDGTTQIKIQSTGNCTNYVIVDVAMSTTSTTTTTVPGTTTTTTTEFIPGTTTTTTTIQQFELSYTVHETDCETDCPRTSGNILINGVSVKSWGSWTLLPFSGILYPYSGDEITINADCWAGGTCGIGMEATISISLNGVECDSAINSPATCTFTISENTNIEITPGCLTP